MPQSVSACETFAIKLQKILFVPFYIQSFRVSECDDISGNSITTKNLDIILAHSDSHSVSMDRKTKDVSQLLVFK